MEISIVIPLFNEEHNIEMLISSILNDEKLKSIEKEIILVNDGSTDKTLEKILKLSDSNKQILVISHEKNLGYSSAIKSGIKKSKLPYTLIMDGDNQFNINEIHKMIKQVLTKQIVWGFRLKRAEGIKRRILGLCWTMMARLLLCYKIIDLNCGMKLIPTKLLQTYDFKTKGPGFSYELLRFLLKDNMKIVQVDLNHSPRLYGEATGAKLKTIVNAFCDLYRIYL